MSAPLTALQPRTQPAVIELLEDLLAQARRGEIQALAIASEVSDRSVGTAFTGDVDIWRMIGAMELLKARLLEWSDS